MVVMGETLPWSPSIADEHTLLGLVAGGQLPGITDQARPEWVVPPASHRVPSPPEGYVVSFIRLHERGFNVPASRFMRALCFYYGVELHNFAPNAISQAATFVAVCEGFLGIEVHWDLWVHLFRGELHTASSGAKGLRRPVRAGGLTFAVRENRKHLYPPCTMTSNNADWEKGWFYLRNDGDRLPAYTGRVLTERPESWTLGVSGPERRAKLVPITDALHALAEAGLTVAAVIANFHRRRVVPLMERALPIFKMTENADPAALARSRTLEEPLPPSYAATRAKRAVETRKMKCGDDDLWSFKMRPEEGYVQLVRDGSLSRLFYFGSLSPLVLIAAMVTGNIPKLLHIGPSYA